MKRLFAISVALLTLLPLPACAHRLDEYLQATILSIGSGRVDGSMRLIPGVAISSVVVANIDTNGDGVLSPAEQQAYAQRVLNDLLLRMDNKPLSLRLQSISFPAVEQMRQGIGEIELNFTAVLPNTAGDHELIFENHHQPGIAVYLVNSLVPQDRNIRLGEQVRNVNQSFYQLSFVDRAGAEPSATSPTLSGFAGAFRLGVRHIAEGIDHLLFLLTLLLPAPLLAFSGRWTERATIRHSLLQIVRIVTAFTVGHSLTLLLSAFGMLRLPSRPVEVLIVISILVSAIHAMRPIFPGREAAIAAFFGLIHGLAFASAITELGFHGWYRLVSIVAFNLGIEAMQLVVVIATLPSLLLLSRTVLYPFFRWTGALIAAAASAGWIAERAFNTPNQLGRMIEGVAHLAPWLALVLFALSLTCWQSRRLRSVPVRAVCAPP